NRAYWDRRRQAARDWLTATPEVQVPALPAGYPAHNAVDHFLGARLAAAVAQAAEARKGTVDYFKQVQPLLGARCCGGRGGAKVKGGRRLDGRAAGLAGGRGDGPAVVPGRPEKSALLARVRSHEPTEVMPPKGDRLTDEQLRTLETWVREGALW